MNKMSRSDMGWKPSLSIIGGVGWLMFIILWLAFIASDYSWEKNIAVILLSILIIFLLIGGMWAVWSLRKIPKKSWETFKRSGFKNRVAVSIILPFAAIIFLIVWFWFYAEPYTIWQNIAVLIVTFLAIGGILGALWARWGMSHKHEMDEMEKFGDEFGKNFEEAFDKKKDDDSYQ